MSERKKAKPETTGGKQASVEKETSSPCPKKAHLIAANTARPDRPESTFKKKGTALSIEPKEGQDPSFYSAQMLEALGTRSVPFLNDTLDGVLRVMSPALDVSEQQYNSLIAFMAAVEPENELEAKLAAQMAATNECAMRCMRSMVGSQMLDHHRMYGDLANKFARTFAAQVDALARLRRGGEQVVKYIHVHEGGQAVVAGTINQSRGAANAGSHEQAYGTGEPEEIPALPGPDPARHGMPIPRDAERTMPHPRREVAGRAKG